MQETPKLNAIAQKRRTTKKGLEAAS